MNYDGEPTPPRTTPDPEVSYEVEFFAGHWQGHSNAYATAEDAQAYIDDYTGDDLDERRFYRVVKVTRSLIDNATSQNPQN